MSVFGPAAVFLNKYTSLWQYGLPPAPQGSRVLLVHCHPLGDSFSAHLAAKVREGLEEGGHRVRVLSLYANTTGGVAGRLGLTAPFPPALRADERAKYHSIAEASGSTAADALQCEALAPEVRKAVALLRWCDAVVFVYPTWWFNVPAALKGFFDRVFLPNVAFRLPQLDPEGRSTETGLVPLLTNIKRVGVVTTYGANRQVTLLAGDNGRQMISRAFRPLFHPDCPFVWMGLHDMDATSPRDRDEFASAVRARFRNF